MANRSNRNRERMKYGLCLNEECPKCTSKEVQAIPMRKDFVCPECGKELRECPPPKKSNKGKIIAGVIAAIIIVGVIAGISLFSGNEKQTPEVTPDTLKVDTPAIKPVPAKIVDSTKIQSDTVIKSDQSSNVKIQGSEVIKTKVTSTVTTITTQHSSSRTSNAGSTTSSTLNLPYGIYKGEVKNGKPNGHGRLTYNTQTQISKYDSKARMAEAGEYVDGWFVDGNFDNGKHFDKSGNLIESMVIGVPN